MHAAPETAWPGPGSVVLLASGFYGSTLTVPALSETGQSNNQSRTRWHDPKTLEPLRAALAWVEGLPGTQRRRCPHVSALRTWKLLSYVEDDATQHTSTPEFRISNFEFRIFRPPFQTSFEFLVLSFEFPSTLPGLEFPTSFPRPALAGQDPPMVVLQSEVAPDSKPSSKMGQSLAKYAPYLVPR